MLLIIPGSPNMRVVSNNEVTKAVNPCLIDSFRFGKSANFQAPENPSPKQPEDHPNAA